MKAVDKPEAGVDESKIDFHRLDMFGYDLESRISVILVWIGKCM